MDTPSMKKLCADYAAYTSEVERKKRDLDQARQTIERLQVVLDRGDEELRELVNRQHAAADAVAEKTTHGRIEQLKKCSVEECYAPQYSGGVCKAHFKLAEKSRKSPTFTCIETGCAGVVVFPLLSDEEQRCQDHYDVHKARCEAVGAALADIKAAAQPETLERCGDCRHYKDEECTQPDPKDNRPTHSHLSILCPREADKKGQRGYAKDKQAAGENALQQIRDHEGQSLIRMDIVQCALAYREAHLRRQNSDLLSLRAFVDMVLSTPIPDPTEDYKFRGIWSSLRATAEQLKADKKE